MLSPVLVTPPAADVVSLEEVKRHLRVDHADDDTVIATLIKAAISHFDGHSGVLGRALVSQTWRQDFNGFWPGGYCVPLRLPLGPAASITGITYWGDASGEQITLPSTVYQLQADALGPFVALKSGQSWPSTCSRSDAVSVEYVAGYGVPEDVPEAFRLAIIMHVKQSYDGNDLSGTIDALIGAKRRISI